MSGQKSASAYFRKTTFMSCYFKAKMGLSKKSEKSINLSLLRMQESIKISILEIPAFAGMTEKPDFLDSPLRSVGPLFGQPRAVSKRSFSKLNGTRMTQNDQF
ncbi:MAG: hypothetical protein D6743_16515, partial [Calditrichaeota bacterium]